jgi:hypothetical protein
VCKSLVFGNCVVVVFVNKCEGYFCSAAKVKTFFGNTMDCACVPSTHRESGELVNSESASVLIASKLPHTKTDRIEPIGLLLIK